MIDFPAVFRALLMASAALFLGALLVFGLRESARQRADLVERMEAAARRPPVTNALPMQAGWGGPAPAEDTDGPDAITGLVPGGSWLQ